LILLLAASTAEAQFENQLKFCEEVHGRAKWKDAFRCFDELAPLSLAKAFPVQEKVQRLRYLSAAGRFDEKTGPDTLAALANSSLAYVTFTVEKCAFRTERVRSKREEVCLDTEETVAKALKSMFKVVEDWGHAFKPADMPRYGGAWGEVFSTGSLRMTLFGGLAKVADRMTRKWPSKEEIDTLAHEAWNDYVTAYTDTCKTVVASACRTENRQFSGDLVAVVAYFRRKAERTVEPGDILRALGTIMRSVGAGPMTEKVVATWFLALCACHCNPQTNCTGSTQSKCADLLAAIGAGDPCGARWRRMGSVVAGLASDPDSTDQEYFKEIQKVIGDAFEV
jgi:hypothetical protein